MMRSLQQVVCHWCSGMRSENLRWLTVDWSVPPAGWMETKVTHQGVQKAYAENRRFLHAERARTKIREGREEGEAGAFIRAQLTAETDSNAPPAHSPACTHFHSLTQPLHMGSTLASSTLASHSLRSRFNCSLTSLSLAESGASWIRTHQNQ